MDKAPGSPIHGLPGVILGCLLVRLRLPGREYALLRGADVGSGGCRAEPATLALMLGALAMLGRIRTRQYVGA